MELRAPGLLHAVPRPQDLLRLRGALEDHRVVGFAQARILYLVNSLILSYYVTFIGRLSTHKTVGSEWSKMDVVNEGDVVGGVPVEAVAVHVEGHRVQHVVDWGDHLQSKAESRRQLLTKNSRQTYFSDTSKSNSQNQVRPNCQ